MIHQQILERLDAIEEEHSVRIPLAVESGSRAWGFASPDSDYDCRFVYVRPKRAYLAVFGQKDTIEYTPDAVFDLNGWDVRKTIEHLVKSNAVMLEWLQSGAVYRRRDEVAQALWQLGTASFCPVKTTWHYLSMARNKLAEIEADGTAILKKYFYVLRPLACTRFIREHNEIPFMEYHRNLKNIDVPDMVRSEIDALMAKKQQTQEKGQIEPNEILLRYFAQEVSLAQNWLSGREKRQPVDLEEANKCFQKILEMTYGDA